MLPIVRRARLQLVVGISIAITLAMLSLLHQHALIPDDVSPAPCIVCAFGADVAVAAPELVAPATVAYILPAAVEQSLLAVSFVAVPSRAPPSVA